MVELTIAAILSALVLTGCAVIDAFRIYKRERKKKSFDDIVVDSYLRNEKALDRILTDIKERE
jgi:hypothetical protein